MAIKMGGADANFGGREFHKSVNPNNTMARAMGAQDYWITEAARARAEGINRAIDAIKGAYDPYKGVGTMAVKRLTDLFTNPASVRQTPGYDFRFNEGRNALEGSAAARGKLLSGGTGKSLMEYGQNFGDTFYGTELDRATQLSNMGYGWDMGSADRLSNLYTMLGASDAQKFGDFSNYAFWHEQQGMDEAKQWMGFLRGAMGANMGGGGGDKQPQNNNQWGNGNTPGYWEGDTQGAAGSYSNYNRNYGNPGGNSYSGGNTSAPRSTAPVVFGQNTGNYIYNIPNYYAQPADYNQNRRLSSYYGGY